MSPTLHAERSLCLHHKIYEVPLTDTSTPWYRYTTHLSVPVSIPLDASLYVSISVSCDIVNELNVCAPPNPDIEA